MVALGNGEAWANVRSPWKLILGPCGPGLKTLNRWIQSKLVGSFDSLVESSIWAFYKAFN